MRRKHDATGPADEVAAPDPARLLALLRDGDVDAAIDAGLMRLAVTVAAVPDAGDRVLLDEAQQRLRSAWQARERHRARETRLARRKAERDARRMPAPAPAAPAESVPPVPSAAPALPPAAAAALARARAKAGGG